MRERRSSPGEEQYAGFISVQRVGRTRAQRSFGSQNVVRMNTNLRVQSRVEYFKFPTRFRRLYS